MVRFRAIHRALQIHGRGIWDIVSARALVLRRNGYTQPVLILRQSENRDLEILGKS
jgi:hypothetical protein